MSFIGLGMLHSLSTLFVLIWGRQFPFSCRVDLLMCWVFKSVRSAELGRVMTEAGVAVAASVSLCQAVIS